MLPVSPAISEPMPTMNNVSTSTLQVPRPRAHTLQGTGISIGPGSTDGSSSGHSIRSAKTNSTSSGSSQSMSGKPPASAPAGVSFTFKMHTSDSDDSRTGEDGYLSDPTSVAESTATYQTSTNSRPPRTPRSAPPHRLPLFHGLRWKIHPLRYPPPVILNGQRNPLCLIAKSFPNNLC